jgi:hypothetical protein
MNNYLMSKLVEIVANLEVNIGKLLQKKIYLDQENKELKEKINSLEAINATQTENILQLKKDNDNLKIANTLLGSNENKRDTKLKINSLIREIDTCIANLSQ